MEMNEFILTSPLLLIGFFAIIIITLDAIFKNRTLNYYFALVSLVITGISSIYTLTYPNEFISSIYKQELLSKQQILFGGYSAFFDLIFIIAGILTLLASRSYLKREYDDYNEYYSLIIYAICGMMIIAHSSNLLMLFIGIEIMSITFYIMAGFFRTSQISVEASLKYFLLGAFASGFLAYGIAMIYGATESINLFTIQANISAGKFNNVYLSIGMGLLVIGLSFKIAAFPFHQWAPDVYTGAPTIITAFMSTAGKAGAVIAFVTISKFLISLSVNNNLSTVIQEYQETFKLIIAVISAATMIIGNITALIQQNVKRMLAYSSVAHAGYILIGVASNNVDGWNGIFFYASAYMFMQLGAFLVLALLENKSLDNLNLNNFAGLYKSHPFLSAAMAIFMLSLAGIPPFAGFFGKYYLFVSAIKANMVWLTVIAVIASIVSMYYYIGLIIQMYFYEQTREPIKITNDTSYLSLVLATAAIIILGVFPSLIIDITSHFF